MTKKLAEALMKHKHDDEVMIDRLVNGTKEESIYEYCFGS